MKPALIHAARVVLFLFAFSWVTSAQGPTLTAASSRIAPPFRAISGEEFIIESAILKEKRRVLVVLPASYSKGSSSRLYPVTVVLDGESLTRLVSIAADELSANGQVPETIIVGIENVGSDNSEASNQKRVYDLTPPGLSVSGSDAKQGGDKFLDFIEQELLPAVDAQFRGAAPRTLIGHSSGGILATYAAATRPKFNMIVSIDGPTHLGDDWLPKKLLTRAAVDKTALRYASYEARFGWSDENWQKLSKQLPQGWKMYREHLSRESHDSAGMIGAYLGLRDVFADYSTLSAPQTPTTSILPYYQKLGGDLGVGLATPPRRVIRNVIEDLLIEGRGTEARKAYDLLVAGYGTPADNASLTKEIAEVEKRPPPTETVESLLATEFATPEEMKPYLGDWVGDVWMNTDEPKSGRETLHIKVVNGKVVGETVTRVPGRELVRQWEYLRKTPTGFSWGYMNGMRPRGVLVSEGTVINNTLTGEIRFGGVNFVLPDGAKPPPIHFSYKKVTP